MRTLETTPAVEARWRSTPTPPSSRGASFAAFKGLLSRDLRVLRKSFGEFLLRTVMQPLLLIFVFTYVLPRLGEDMGIDPGRFATMLVPGMVALAVVMQGIQSVAMPMVHELSLTREIEDRALAPLPLWLVAVEKIVAGAINGLIAAGVVFPLAAIVPAEGVQLEVNWAVLTTAGPLACVAAAAGGLTLATLCEIRSLPVVFNFFLLPLTFLGGILFPWGILEPLPWLQYVVLLNPILYMSEGLRAALVTTSPHLPLPAIYAGLTGFTVLFFGMGTSGFLRRVQIGDDTGVAGSNRLTRKANRMAKMGRKGWLVLVASVTAAAVVAVFVVTARDDDKGDCPTDASPDSSYNVVVEGSPRVGDEPLELLITHDGQPVEDADVCFTTAMVGMEEMGAAAEATEASGAGRYRVSPEFEMMGEFSGQVVISEPGRRPVSVPVSVEVMK